MRYTVWKTLLHNFRLFFIEHVFWLMLDPGYKKGGQSKQTILPTDRVIVKCFHYGFEKKRFKNWRCIENNEKIKMIDSVGFYQPD